MNAPQPSSMPAEPVQNVARQIVARAKRDPWLRAIAIAGVTVLIIGLRQEPEARFGRWTMSQRLGEPIEVNPVARLPVLPEANLHALWFFDRNEALAAGESGTLLRTANGGRNWTLLTLPEESIRNDDSAGRLSQETRAPAARKGFYALAFRSGEQDTGFVGGRDGRVFVSQDRGVTWQLPEDVAREQQALPAIGDKATSPSSLPPVAAGGSEGWKVTDVGALAVNTIGLDLYRAGPWGLVEHQPLRIADNPKVISRQDVRGIVLGNEAMAYAGPKGLIIRYPAETPDGRPTEEIRSGDYTALSAHAEMLFAAGDRFRMERLRTSRPQQQQQVVAVPVDNAWVAAEKPKDPEEAKLTIQGCSLASDGAGWAVGDGGAIWLVKPTRLVGGELVDGRGNRIAASNGQGLAIGGAEALSVLRRDVPGFTNALYAVWAFSANEAVVAGTNGAVFRTRDGGATWAAVTGNCWPAERRGGWWMKFPAPWCWLALLALAGAGWARWQRLPAAVEERDAVAEELTSDRPLEPGEADRLGFDPLVQGLSRYLRNTATQAPLTLAVTGAWGAGKSSFMNLLRSDLDGHGLRTVWFNAWHHQQEPQILAPLLSAIQAEAAPPLLSDQFALSLRFRWRLLLRRIWPPGKLMLWSVAFIGFMLGVGAALEWKMPFDVLSDMIGKLAAEDDKPSEALRGLINGSSFLGAFFLLAWKALKTFGVNPADLLATEVGKTSEHALSAQAAFRREFADQFSEVTAALEPYPLVIFIDDLDRCEVPKVFQILEAINYLVSSGGCYVVLGMSEERVRDAVALGFKELPADFGEAEAARATKAPDESAAPTSKSPQEAWARQRELAQNYLEKLVQLRIDVPRPDVESAKRMVQTEAARAAEKAPASRWEAVAAWWRDHGFTLAALAGVLLVLAASFQVGGWVAPLLKPAEKTNDASKSQEKDTGIDGQTLAALTAEAAYPAQFAFVHVVTCGTFSPASFSWTGWQYQQSWPEAVQAGGGTGTQGGAGAIAHLHDDRGLAPTMPRAGRDGWVGWIAGGFMVLLIVGAVWLGESLWQKRLSVMVRDSRDFNKACEEWTEALLRLQGDRITPRGLKRFKNRVRFYAMMRSEEGTAGLLPGASDASLVALGAMELAGFISPGQFDRGDLNLGRLMESPLDDSLKNAAVQAVDLLKDESDEGRKIRATKKALKRA